jgi:hypothetical protein
MSEMECRRRDFLQALCGWRYFARRPADKTDRALRMFCQAQAFELGPDAMASLFVELWAFGPAAPA